MKTWVILIMIGSWNFYLEILMKEEVTIGPISEPSRYWEIMDVIRDAWSMPDYTEAVPPHMMKAIEDNGGLILAAFNGEGKIVGFVMGFIGKEGKEYYHYSHMLGVRKEYRGKNVALRLKLAQREWAINQGFKRVVWTYDPHQGLNARFNFAKLGVVCNKFYRDYYGVMKDGINIGLPSDRFKVDWWILSQRVIKRTRGELPSPTFDDVKDMAEEVVKSTINEYGLRVVKSVDIDLRSSILLVEFPGDINILKKSNLKVAIEWKIRLRPVFEEYFKRGYYVVEHITLLEDDERRNFYLLWKASLKDILSGVYPWS